MDDTVFTLHAVTTRWPFLGLCIPSHRVIAIEDSPSFPLSLLPLPQDAPGSQATTPTPSPPTAAAGGQRVAGRSNEAALAMAAVTWSKASTKMADRVLTAQHQHLSFGRRAFTWNVYVVSLLPYLAHCAPRHQGS